MSELRRLTTLWASTAGCRNSSIFLLSFPDIWSSPKDLLSCNHTVILPWILNTWILCNTSTAQNTGATTCSRYLRAKAHQGNWQPQRNRSFGNCYQPELNTCYWMVQSKLRKRERNSQKYWETQLPGNWACQFSHNCVASWFLIVSSSIMRFSDSFVSFHGTEDWWSF
jgi:hypothetical protein